MISPGGTLNRNRALGGFAFYLDAHASQLLQCGMHVAQLKSIADWWKKNGFVRRLYSDGADLLREAAIERFDLERDGWIANPRAAGKYAGPIRV